MTNPETVQEAVQTYRLALSAAREKVRLDLEARVLQETLGDRVALSKVLHAAHEAGTPIATLKVLTKAHNNASAWYPLWTAYAPENPTDLRRRATAAKNVSPVRQDAENESTWWVTYEGTEYPMYDVVWLPDQRAINFDADRMMETAPDKLYGKVWSVLLNHFRAVNDPA